MIFSKLSELRNLSKEELETQAGLAIWLLLNEVYEAKDFKFITAPIRDLPYLNDKLECQLELVTLELAPNKSTTLGLAKENV